MKRPSRAKRESATTMLKNGRLLAPPRASRITTMTSILKSEARDFTRVIPWFARKVWIGEAASRGPARGLQAPAWKGSRRPPGGYFYFSASPGFPEWNT